MMVSKEVASVHDISAVNLAVGWYLFACLINFSTHLCWCARERLCRQYNVSKPVVCERFRLGFAFRFHQ